ncbi:MAG TPA: hypothetical protein H9797_02745 [Candidatus Gallimonas gallistercoris]|uniref:Uncharacterized protein n=1 Tax=Candidatus Gallimonas gallistercoris TaxID=2838602 RepID=A0A9D2KEU6_9FIRM|nr:hypothetical protein [Candidatus Gallimonas gallistercoris]
MKERTRKIFIMIVMAALIVSLMAASFAALTYGRYSGGRRDENSAYEDILDLVGETAFEVSTADELVNAINNGYSYIKVVGDDPTLVVNNNVADVVVNLVLDVNGHKIVRNSRNPLLNVRQSVSVVLVYDSSEKAEGGFYNPVGSALQTSGGTLTVGEGVYESGPRTGIGLDFSYTVSATVCSRDGRKAASYSVQKTDQTFPKLTEKTGDVYFDENYSGTGDYLKADTYLIYTEEKNAFVGDGNGSGKFEDGQLYVNRKETSSGETTTITADKFSPICDVASCDFYYYYPVGTAGTANSPQTYAVVYGYNEVKGLAKTKNENLTSGNETNLVWPYAAIRSEAGNTHARGGEFYTYFGEENTYSIYSEGGTMTVGLSGESDPPKFQAIGKGVCINMAGTSGNADQTLTIENGEFSSKIGDTIKMSGGEMEVKKGSFTKDATVLGAASGDGASNGSAISISGGTLTSSDTEDTSKPIQFHISGSYVNGIYAKGGEVNIANATFAFENGKNNQGVYNDGGTSRAHWCDFTIPGNNNYGIHSTNGTTRASDCAIKMTGEYAVGVYTTGGRALVEGGRIDVTFAENKSDGLLTSAAVSTEGGEIYLAGNLAITSHSLGVTVRQGEDTSGLLEIATDTITTTDGTTYSDIDSGNVTINTPNATGIYVNNGNLTNKGTVTVTSSVGNEEGADKGWNWVNAEGNPLISFNKYNGVYVNGGSLVSEGTLNVTFTGVENENSGTYLDQQIKSYAVRVEAAASGGETEVSIAGGTISNSVGGGVYVGGGTVTLGVKNGNKGPTVQTTGKLLYTSWLEVVGGSWKYMLNKSGGHAVEVSGGSLTVHGGNYTSQQGNGILIRNTADVKTTNTVTIEDGSFVGYNSGYYIEYDGQTPLGGDRMVGPAASYGLNVMGHDLDVRINGGEFGNNEGDVGNSAASFFGTPDGSRPQVAVHGGTFNANNADAISVFRFIDITFDGTASKISSNISNGAVASLSVQNDLLYTGESDRGSTIEIQSGTFTGTAYGIWYACGYDKLSISGDATIKGPTGLQVASAPVENGITISGGTIEGGTEGIYYNASASVSGEGYGLNITGGIIRGTGNNKNGHALNIVVEPKKHAIHIGGEAQLFGGRDAIYVNNAGGEEDAVCVSITGGTFTGAEQDTTAGDYGCAIWFDSGMNSSVYQITGGTFITKEGGSAIWTSSPVTHYLWQIFPDGCSITDGEGNSFNRNWNFNTTIKGKSQITVSMS